MRNIHFFSWVRSLDVTWWPDHEWHVSEIFTKCAKKMCEQMCQKRGPSRRRLSAICEKNLKGWGCSNTPPPTARRGLSTAGNARVLISCIAIAVRHLKKIPRLSRYHIIINPQYCDGVNWMPSDVNVFDEPEGECGTCELADGVDIWLLYMGVIFCKLFGKLFVNN